MTTSAWFVSLASALAIALLAGGVASVVLDILAGELTALPQSTGGPGAASTTPLWTT